MKSQYTGGLSGAWLPSRFDCDASSCNFDMANDARSALDAYRYAREISRELEMSRDLEMGWPCHATAVLTILFNVNAVLTLRIKVNAVLTINHSDMVKN